MEITIKVSYFDYPFNSIEAKAAVAEAAQLRRCTWTVIELLCKKNASGSNCPPEENNSHDVDRRIDYTVFLSRTALISIDSCVDNRIPKSHPLSP